MAHLVVDPEQPGWCEGCAALEAVAWPSVRVGEVA